MTCMRAGRSSKFSQIRLRTSELAALERLKKIPIDLLWKMFSAVLDKILFLLAGTDNIHKSLDEVETWSAPTTDHRVNCP